MDNRDNVNIIQIILGIVGMVERRMGRKVAALWRGIVLR